MAGLTAVRRLARRVLPRPARGVNVVGYLDATSGLGERARELVATLRAGGIDVSEWSIPPRTRTSGSTGPVFDTTIAMVTAVQLADVTRRVPRPFDEAERTVGYFFWELADVPDEQQWGIGLVDEIWAPTTFVADAYRRATERPVRLVPLPLPRPRSTPGRALGSANDPFEILVCLDLLSVMERKNPIGAISAFQRAFPTEAGVALTIKTLNGDRRATQHDRLVLATRDDPRITVRDGWISDEAMHDLIAGADVLLSLHRSEGLGLHLAEAMALDTLVVASRFGGNVDFMSDDCAGLVEVREVEVFDGEGAYRPPAHWGDPDLDQAAELLHRAFADPGWSRRLRDNAMKRIDGSPSRPEVAARLVELLAWSTST